MTADLTLSQLCGQLLVGGFDGTELPARVRSALAGGSLAGVILFSRNVASLEQVAELCAAAVDAAPASAPPFISVDQEGGRVARLKAPFLELPPMRAFGDADDLELSERAAAELGRQLAVLGFNLDFAPVMDVDSNPDNPVIGDRSFGRAPRTVIRHGLALLRGLQSAGVLACAKHFPGHGDTALDSHLALPRVDHPRERLDRVELPPFRAAAEAGVAAMMTAHVVYPALDGERAATLSPAISTRLLRDELAFDGVLFSDDLEMGALDGREVEENAVDAIAAGCDALLVCRDLDLQARAHEALVHRAERDSSFRERCREAAARTLRLRRRCPPRPERDPGRVRHLVRADDELAARLAKLRSNATAER